MPGNVTNAAPSGVMPYALCTAFSESREYAQLQAQYHDGTVERSQIAQTSRKSFRLAQRITAAAALKVCWDGQQQGGLIPFLFYNMAERPTIPPATRRWVATRALFRDDWTRIWFQDASPEAIRRAWREFGWWGAGLVAGRIFYWPEANGGGPKEAVQLAFRHDTPVLPPRSNSGGPFGHTRIDMIGTIHAGYLYLARRRTDVCASWHTAAQVHTAIRQRRNQRGRIITADNLSGLRLAHE